MRAQLIAIAAAALATVPALALAQNPAAERNLENDFRLRQTQEDLRQYQQAAPAAANAEQRLNDLDQRVRTQQNLESITPPPGPVYHNPNVQAPLVNLPNSIDLNAQAELMAKELSSENARLKKYNP